MEEWSRSLVEAVETTVSEVEKFFTDVTEEFNKMVDDLTHLSDEITQEVQTKLIPELEECFNDLVEPFLDIYFDLDSDLEGETFEPFVTYVHPNETQHPACRRCTNYHGHVYGGNLLVCAMHPSGVEGNTCPDWEEDTDPNPF